MSIPKSRRFTVFIKFDSRGKIVIDGYEITISLKIHTKRRKSESRVDQEVGRLFCGEHRRHTYRCRKNV